MSKQYTTIITLEDYPEKFETTKARDVSILPTLYGEATGVLGLELVVDPPQRRLRGRVRSGHEDGDAPSDRTRGSGCPGRTRS